MKEKLDSVERLAMICGRRRSRLANTALEGTIVTVDGSFGIRQGPRMVRNLTKAPYAGLKCSKNDCKFQAFRTILP
jgi:hypothetical protein